MKINEEHSNWVKPEDLQTVEECDKALVTLENDRSMIIQQIENADKTGSADWLKNARWARTYKNANIRQVQLQRRILVKKLQEERENSETHRFINLVRAKLGPQEYKALWDEVHQTKAPGSKDPDFIDFD